MKHLLTFIFLTTFIITLGQSSKKNINPTGTYKLDSKVTRKDGDTYGYFGTIQVRLLSYKKIVMTFYICKGAPSYNSGSFVDTLLFNDNKAVYSDEDTARKCVTTFLFSATGIDVTENANYDLGTCWGAGVFAKGHFIKTSSKDPTLIEPLTGEEIK